MDESIEMLNRWGENFWGFAGPMLWQSSLLIAVVLAIDLVSARRIRASVRYALWMVVLVKLILPPALALPTSATWWLWRPHPAVESPMVQNYTVSFDSTVPADTAPSAAPIAVAVPPPKLNGDAWVLLATAAMTAALLLWLAFRWLRVARTVRRAAAAPAELDGILEEVRKLTGLRRRPRLRLIDDAQSPAVYGLFRPVILLPRMLANRISERQLRAVLLHEAIHLRRGDVWINFAQTLLQIAYWWHPLLWVANARIRRVREEAVDDAVMLALRDGADAYAPTLLEVAKFAFRRPLASLGLVGILESRSALRQRVERLIDFRPPRKAGITFLSLCGIFAFCTVALPMGQGPEQPAASARGENVSHNSFELSPDPNSGAEVAYDPTTRTTPVGAQTSTSAGGDALETRNFTIKNIFVQNLQMALDPSYTGGSYHVKIVPDFKRLLSSQGVDLDPSKSISFKQGVLSVRANRYDLDLIGKEIQVLNGDVPQIHIKARFFEVPRDFFSSSSANALPAALTNGAILTEADTRSVLSILESQEGFEDLAEPEMVTRNRGQAEIRATVLQGVITNYVARTNGHMMIIGPQVDHIETGPILNITPYVFSDGHSISLDATAELTQWFGYAGSLNPLGHWTRTSHTKPYLGVATLPALQLSQAREKETVYDGETLVLFPKPVELLLCGSDKKDQETINTHIQQEEEQDGNKVVVALVTATLVDAAGNRINSDDEIPMAR